MQLPYSALQAGVHVLLRQDNITNHKSCFYHISKKSETIFTFDITPSLCIIQIISLLLLFYAHLQQNQFLGVHLVHLQIV